MDVPTTFDPDIQIVGIEFAEGYGAIEITFIERRNVAPQAFKRESITVDAELLNKEELADVIDSLGQFLDTGLLHIRSAGGQ